MLKEMDNRDSNPCVVVGVISSGTFTSTPTSISVSDGMVLLVLPSSGKRGRADVSVVLVVRGVEGVNFLGDVRLGDTGGARGLSRSVARVGTGRSGPEAARVAVSSATRRVCVFGLRSDI